MIELKYTLVDGNRIILERELSNDEFLSVTSERMISDGDGKSTGVKRFYQGDEPNDEITNPLSVNLEPEKINISNVDLSTLTDDQIKQLAQRLKGLL